MWKHVFQELTVQDILDETALMPGSTIIKVRQHGGRAKKGGEEALGCSRGGLTTKVRAVVDGLGNPLRLMRSPGNRNDICYAWELLEPYDLQGRYVTADKGYDSGSFVEWLKKRGAIVVIPSRRTAKHPRSIDRHIYFERYWVGNLFLELKVHRRFSTRYEK